MNDHAKTKEELIQELVSLRREHAALASSGPDDECKHAKALQLAERKYRSLVEATDTGYVIIDNQGRVLDANQEYLRLTGRTRLEDILGHSVLEWTAPYDHARNGAEVRKCAEQGSVRNLVIDYCGPDGTIRSIEINATVTGTGEELSILSLCRDITERGQIEKKLKDTVSLLKATLASTADGILVVDNQGRISDYNEQFARLWRIPPGLLELHDDRKAIDFVLDQLKAPEQFVAKVRELYNHPEMVSIDVLEFKDGRVFERYSQPQKIDGVSVGRVWSFSNITERKQAEDALRVREAQLSNALKIAQLGHWEYDVAGDRFTFNDHFYEMLHTTAEQVGGYTMSSSEYVRRFVHPGDVAIVGTAIRKALETADPQYSCQLEHRIIYADGKPGHVAVRVFIVKDGDGRTVQTFGVNQDITERKLAEEDIRRSEEHYRQLYNAIMDAVVVHEVRPDGVPGRFLEVNEVACTRLGYTRQELLQMTPHDIDAPESGADVKAVSRKVLAGEVVTFEQIHVAKDGRRIPVEINARRFNLGTRHVVLSIVRDITERKRAAAYQTELEEERLKSQKLESIGTLAGGIAHDFNNLLQGVFGYISMAKLGFDQKEKSVAMLEHAEAALHLAVNLTTQLLTFAKGGKPVRKRMKLMPAVETAVKFALSGSHSNYHIDTAAGLWPVEADEGQLAQVIQNIVQNADQAMAGQGTVTVALENAVIPENTAVELPAGGRFVRIAIHDSGTGIPEQNISRIFDPYFTTKQKGSGLGLATSYSIIKNHGGVIRVKSEVSKGSTFTIYLPAAEGTEEAKGPSLQAAVRGKKGRVLFMDDEDMMRNVGKVMIEALGHEMESAEDGSAAIKKYVQARETGSPFNIVILDLTVKGGMGGTETLSRLREIDPAIVAVASSGYADNAVLANYREYGFSAFLNKPYDIDALRDCLNALLK
jgi:PAS domain S-box-containing protein